MHSECCATPARSQILLPNIYPQSGYTRIEPLPTSARLAHYQAERFAHLCGFGLRVFERAMHASAGCTPKRFLSVLRAVEAAHAVLQGSSPKQAASEFHYHDTPHLYREFHALFCATPLELIAAGRSGDTPPMAIFVSLRENDAFIQNAGVAILKKIQHRENRSSCSS